MKLQDINGKKAVIMGLGQVEKGSGISAAKFLLRHGASVLVTDFKQEQELQRQVAALNSYAESVGAPRPEYVFGQHRKQDFLEADLVMRNPGVPASFGYLKLASERGVPIETDLSLFFGLVSNPIVGITGTRGKSTTTSLLHEMYRLEYPRARIGGNIAISPLTFIDELEPDDPVILEISSFQAESLAFVKKSPHIGVVTNLYPDHLDKHADMEDYARAKQCMLGFQGPEDIAVLNWQNDYARAMGEQAGGRVMWFSLRDDIADDGAFVRDGWIVSRIGGREERIAEVASLRIPGEHNVANAAAATAAALAGGISKASIAKALKDFQGMPHRLQFVVEHEGVAYYDDTTATTPEAAMAALRSFEGPVVLIAGGSEKNLSFDELGPVIAKRAKHVVLFEDAASPRLEKAIRRASNSMPIERAGSMPEAVEKAAKAAGPGDTVLLSPAAASFGLFRNEFDRGEQFQSMVERIIQED